MNLVMPGGPAMSGSVTTTFFAGSLSESLKACISAGLVGGKEFAVDATLIVADANKQRSIPGSEWTVRKITRDLNEDVRDRVRALADTEAFQHSRRERKKPRDQAIHEGFIPPG
jgi:hypothetical protein